MARRGHTITDHWRIVFVVVRRDGTVARQFLSAHIHHDRDEVLAYGRDEVLAYGKMVRRYNRGTIRPAYLIRVIPKR